MRGYRTSLAVIGLVSLIVAEFGLPAGAFELLRSSQRTCSADTNLRWSPALVRVDTGKLGAADRGLAEQALSRWRDVAGSRLTFSSGVGGVCDLDDGIVTMAFTDTDCLGASFDGNTLAITVTSWTGNRITDADVSFNPSTGFSDARFRQVAMHELGHVIGLDHSDACGDSGLGTLMNSRLVESFGAPQPDDVAGMNFVYASGQGPTPTPRPDAGVPDGANGCAISAPVSVGAWPLSIGILALMFRGRRRCRRARPDRY